MVARDLEPGFPKLSKETRPWKCRKGIDSCSRGNPCNSCRGARNRRSGMRKQREARKALEALSATDAGRFAGMLGNEEAWHGLPLRVEVKSGAAAKVVATKYRASSDQSAATKAVGDGRPFIAVFMPPGWGTNGLVVCELAQLSRLVEALVNL